MASLQRNDRLDGFCIERPLYDGAMAQIYLARDLLTDEVLALKIPFGDILNNPILYYHYQNEERIGRLLQHPNIVRFFYRNRSQQYIVEEYVPGADLRSWAGKGKQLPWADILAVILQLVDAVAYLHSQGVVHLDLKPENILLFQNQVKLIDFGLAFSVDMPDLLAKDFSSPHGTPFYIAPEQMVGIRGEPRSDIYSIGVILYEMVTGALPFPRSKKLSKTRLRLKSDPAPPRYYAPDLDPRLQEIILKCLARLPAHRYQTALELIGDLQHMEKVKVTAAGLRRKKPCWLLRQWLPAVSFPDLQVPVASATGRKTQLVGAVIDDASAELVVEELRGLALLQEAEVTLLTVLEEKDDSHYVQYGLEVAGERFRTRLERFVQKFRRYNIDPTIRLIRGRAVDVILSVARQIEASIVVLGPSRKPGLFGNSVVKKIMAQCEAQVKVAREASHPLIWKSRDLPPDQLRAEQILSIDLFLVDSWFHHVEWLTALAVSLLQKTSHRTHHMHEHCAVGTWLMELHNDSQWSRMAARIDPVHNQLHVVAREMVSLADSGDMSALKNVYRTKALPLSCELRTQMAAVSGLIREWSGQRDVQQIPALCQTDCPLFQEEMPVGGPLLALHTIRNYLDTHIPDVIGHVDQDPITTNSEG